MAPPATTLPELIDQLGRTYSPFERLKIVGRAWALLKSMPPDQRLAVAAQLGLDRADEVVEAIATRGGGKASPVLLSMIEQAQKKGTAQLPQLISDLRDPGRRAERLRQGLHQLEDAAVAAATDVKAPWLPPALTAEPAVVAPPPAQAVPTPPAPVAVPVAPAPPAAPVAVASVAVASVDVASVAVAPAPPAPEPAPAPPPPPVVAAKPPAPAPPEALDGVASMPSLGARFRELRRGLPGLGKSSAAGLGALVQSFPDGWARRRALQELLRAGIPAALNDALALIETLGAERDQMWCLGTIAADREISASEREGLLAALASPSARRRLAARMDRRIGI